MSGIERITAKILEQARLQAENRVNHARENADRAEANLKRRFERALEAERRKASADGEEAARRVIANAMLEGRKKKLAARQDAVNLVFDKVIGHMAGLPESEYMEFMAKLAKTVLSDGVNELIMNDRDRKGIGPGLVQLLKKDTGKKVSLSEEHISTAGGLIVKNGDIQTNLTLEAIIRLEREQLEADVVGILFESGKDAT